MSEQAPVNPNEYNPEANEDSELKANFVDRAIGYADLIIDDADNVEPSETLETIQAMLRGLDKAAGEGLVVDNDGVLQTPEDIYGILDRYSEWANKSVNDRGESPLKSLPRKLESAFSELAYDDRTAGALMEALKQSKFDRIKVEVPVPTGVDLQELMGAHEARDLIGIDKVPELEPEVREKIEDDLAEEALEQVGIEEPKESTAPLVSEFPKIDPFEAQRRLEKEDAERAISREDLSDLERDINDLLYQFNVLSDTSDPSARVRRHELASDTLLDRLAGKIKQEGEGVRVFPRQTLAYEFGAYLAMAENPNVVTTLMDEARKAELFSEEELTAMEADIAALLRSATAQGDGDHFHAIVDRLQSSAARQTDVQKMGPVDFAIRGALVGTYTHMGEPEAVYYANGIHNSNMASFDKIKK